ASAAVRTPPNGPRPTLRRMTDTDDVQRISEAWDDALGCKDLDAAIALYTDDAVLQSPLICHLLGAERGVVEGKAALREFVALVFERTPPTRRRHRNALFTDGRSAVWEYPRETPDGDQLDLVE